MSVVWPTFKECQFVKLAEGPSNGVILDIAPTMRSIVHQGETYNRVDGSRSHRDGTDDLGGCYLWAGWFDQVLVPRLAQEKLANPNNTSVREDR